MKWSNTFTFKGKKLYYNRIIYNNPSERGVEVSIGFDFLANAQKGARMLEVGNVLSNYENSLSEHLNIRSRRIVDKFEDDIGVDQIDLMEIPSTEKYDAILSISTVEHIGQGVAPFGAYGESTIVRRDREAPLKAIAKIYDLLAINGKALVTVPFGKLIDGEWYIQFSQEYLELLTGKYGISKSDCHTSFFKKTDMQTNTYNPYQVWVEAPQDELQGIEYNLPFSCANSVAIIELNKNIEDYSLNIDLPETSFLYHQPIRKKYNLGQPTQSLYQTNDQQLSEVQTTTIIIDGVFFQLYNTGIARVWKSLLQEWLNTDFAQYIVVLDRGDTVPKLPNIRYRSIPLYNYGATEQDREILQQICDEEGADLFISTYYTTPISTPSVFMAYDMIPEVLGADFNEPMWREKHHAIRHASAYISISENTASDLVKCFSGISPEQVTVAHCGVSNTFSPATQGEIQQFKMKFGITKPYFILVGAGSNYKNAGLFFQAFDQLYSKQGFEIVCTGGSSLWLSAEYRQFTSGCVVHPLQLSDEELAIAYSGAVALVYPSLYEGFGMPVAEAMACGCPVITCKNSSIPEVAGEAAIYVNETDVNTMANALCEIQKPQVRHQLIETGLQQVQKFTWLKMADTVSSALINQTLQRFNLGEYNVILFPDWSQPEESLSIELGQVIKSVLTHPKSDQITLLIDSSNISGEEADLALSSIIMNLMMEEELEIADEPNISLIGQLSDAQWSALIPRLQNRIILENENSEVISTIDADQLKTCTLSSLADLHIK